MLLLLPVQFEPQHISRTSRVRTTQPLKALLIILNVATSYLLSPPLCGTNSSISNCTGSKSLLQPSHLCFRLLQLGLLLLHSRSCRSELVLQRLEIEVQLHVLSSERGHRLLLQLESLL